MDQAITLEVAQAAGWTDEEIQQMNDEAWNASRIATVLSEVKKRGLEFFYHVGTNDNVCPAMKIVGERYPDFPLYILPGGQHGGPKESGFTLQTPSQPEADQNLYAFAAHHFPGHRSLPLHPEIKLIQEGGAIRVSVFHSGGIAPETNRVSWTVNRSLPCTYSAEYDEWESVALEAVGNGQFTALIPLSDEAGSIDVVSTHKHVENGIPFHFSSPYLRWSR